MSSSSANYKQQCPLIATEDGSLSLSDPETGELFHNRAGAYLEALQNYVLPSEALNLLAKNGELHLLDVCFGLGYNSFVLIEEILKAGSGGKLSICAIEANEALSKYLSAILNSGFFPNLNKEFPLAEFIQNKTLSILLNENLQLQFRLLNERIEDSLPQMQSDYDLVFHDPFSPKRMPELWTVDIFRKYASLLRAKGGAILTYSCAAAVGSGLIQSGFHLARTAAVGRKSGGSIAALNAADSRLQIRLESWELEKLQSASGVPYENPDFKLSREEVLAKRRRTQAALAGGGIRSL